MKKPPTSGGAARSAGGRASGWQRRSSASMQRIQRPRATSIPALRGGREVVVPGALHDAAAMMPGDLHGPVGRSRVHDDDLVRHRQDGLQAPRQEPLLVLGDQADGEQHGGAGQRAQEWKKEAKRDCGMTTPWPVLSWDGTAPRILESRAVSMTFTGSFVCFMGSPFAGKHSMVAQRAELF